MAVDQFASGVAIVSITPLSIPGGESAQADEEG